MTAAPRDRIQNELLMTPYFSLSKGRGITVSALTLVVLVGLSLSGCEQAAPPRASKNPRVVVTSPIIGTVIDYQDFTGRLEAVYTIEVRSRVSGYITEARFKEGDRVEVGQVLFKIDGRIFDADFNQSEANYKLALADLNLQQKNHDRARKLRSINANTPEEYDTTVAALLKAEALVGAAHAAREKAKLYLEYTKVRWERDDGLNAEPAKQQPPLTGVISRRYVDPGNLVTADNTILTTIVTENPMYAYFDVDERTFLNLLGSISPGQKAWQQGMRYPVMMRLANEKEFERMGQIDFIDNRVVATTGTVRMRGVLQNPEGVLKSGLFVRIRLPTSSPYDAVLVPDEAILSDQERKYVWVVNAKSEVEYRSVTLGQSIKDLRVVRPAEKGKEGKQGLSPSDQVIVSGMQRVRNGSRVELEKRPSPAVPEVPLVQRLRQAANIK
jgi:RND family efflux transporter MFP subunit